MEEALTGGWVPCQRFGKLNKETGLQNKPRKHEQSGE